MMVNNNFQRFKLRFLSKVMLELRLAILQKIQAFCLAPLKRKKEEANISINKHLKNIFKEKEISIMVSMKFLFLT
jgi:hypothetical protein